jgi:archaetidylinositol phosphate synthase
MLDAILGSLDSIRAAQSQVARVFHRHGVTANQATAAGLAAGLMSGIGFATGWRDWGIILLGASAALDAIDGTIARDSATVSTLGGIFDLCADRLVEIAVLIGIVWQRPALDFPALILAGSWYLNITIFLATGAATRGDHRTGGKLIAYPPGLVERTEAIIFFVILALATRAGAILCYGYAVLEIVTALQRLHFARRMLQSTD